MTLTPWQTATIIAMTALGTMITRFLPFILFKGENANNTYIRYLGQVLPYAAIGLLVVYCLKDVDFLAPAHGLPEALAVLCTVLLHYRWENTLLSIGAGTLVYMLLVQAVFV